MVDLKADIRRLGPWHHDIEIAPGIRTGDPALQPDHAPELGTPSINRPERDMGLIIGNLFPDGMAGRTFLDCACNAGGHAFAARALGAGRCFGFDVRAHWIDQARFVAGRRPDSAGVDFALAALSDLPALALDPFDVTLFRGILYHLPDPVAGLKLAADLTREILIVNTVTRPGFTKALRRQFESDTEVMSGVDGLAWLPTGPAVVQDILRYCGFPHSRVRINMKTSPIWNRIEIIAAREAQALAHFDTTRPDCQPGKNRREREGVWRRLRASLR